MELKSDPLLCLCVFIVCLRACCRCGGRDRLKHGVTPEEKEYFADDCKRKLEYVQKLEGWRDRLKPKAENWKYVKFPIVDAPPKRKQQEQ